jgi:hypothetical protein
MAWPRRKPQWSPLLANFLQKNVVQPQHIVEIYQKKC